MTKHITEQVRKRVKGEARKKKQKDKAEINELGQEVCDPQPLYAEAGFKEAPSINDRIREITLQVQAETAAKLQAQNMTEEQIQQVLDEEDDFDMPEAVHDILTIVTGKHN